MRTLLPALAITLYLTSCGNPSRVINVDKEQLSFAPNEIVELTGTWNFYWDTLLNPQQILSATIVPAKIAVPSSWTENGYDANGKATYHRVFVVPDSIRELSVYIPKIWTNSRVWINGKLYSERGNVEMADSRKNFILETLSPSIPVDGRLEIVAQVANKDIYIAGLIYPLKVGNQFTLHSSKTIMEGGQTFWMGCLLVMGLYHLFLFLFNRKDKASFYISCISILLGIKMMAFGENIFYQWLKLSGIMDFKWQSTLYYLATYMVGGFGCLFIQVLYTKVGEKKVTDGFFYVISAYCLFLVVTPLHIYSGTLLPFQVILGLAVVYIFYVVLKSVWVIKSITQNTLQIAGILIMVLAAMNDGLYEYGLKLGLPQELLPYAFIMVIFIQMIILAYERKMDRLEIDGLVDELELKVKRRTRTIREQKDELLAKTKELEELDQLKNKYFANISHDFRAPLANINGYFLLVREDENNTLTEESKRYLEQVEDVIRNMTSLSEQIAHLIKINSQGIELNLQETNLSELILEQVDGFKFQIEAKQLNIYTDQLDAEVTVQLDRDQFFRVIQNLVGNAIQHTPTGGDVHVEMNKVPEGISLKILNSGTPIEAEVLPRIFERFFTYKEGGTVKGLGLGLELTKEIVHLHQGTISATIEREMTCFEVVLKA